MTRPQKKVESKNNLRYALSRYPEELTERSQNQPKGQDQPQKNKQYTIFRLNNSHQESASTVSRQETITFSSQFQGQQIVYPPKLNQSKNKLNQNQDEPYTPRFEDSRKNEEDQQLQQDDRLSIPKNEYPKDNQKPSLYIQDQDQFKQLNEIEWHNSNYEKELQRRLQ
ncbi:UNKNOWN [Stylonychia lemnae]|uniref:Uncharacterized protein n=1 Tax=Stylonychia lemnae TaxID=5949 RepID=A0A078B9C1_STYLE|nr:UNKNOWN [Stylonychia lemnae]|eukprot:CDW90168.1 UNKNOWN [Stylonychia lemnae]